MTYETIPNAPKYYELHRNISLGCKGVDWVRSLKKIQTWHRGTKFVEKIQTKFVAKHESSVQWGRSGPFAGKNYYVTSWHELLH
jgi:hypothetical protein